MASRPESPAAPEQTGEFSISTGGLLPRLRLTLTPRSRDRYCTISSIAIFVTLTWLPLLALTLVAGSALADIPIPFFHDPLPHVRYLIAGPLLLATERVVDRRLAGVVEHLRRSSIVPARSQGALEELLRRLARLRDSPVVDPALIAIALASAWMLSHSQVIERYAATGETWAVRGGSAQQLAAAGSWSLWVSAPLFQFLALRWLWRLASWSLFLKRVAALDLEVRPAHPDLCGGLLFVGRGQASFALPMAAITASAASAGAHQILFAGATFADLGVSAAVCVAFAAIVVVLPLLFFSGKLAQAKQVGLASYGALGDALTDDFHRKWILRDAAPRGSLPLAADPSTLVDFAGIYATASRMRPAPLDVTTLVQVIAPPLVAFLPMALAVFTPAEIVRRLAELLL